MSGNAQEGTAVMYRLYNPNSGEHFYTQNVEERDGLINVGWRYENISWIAPLRSSVPVYRLYNPNAGDHHYTIDKEERDHLISVGWRDENIGWYSDENQGVPLYRQYNPNAREAGSHNYTPDVGERDHLISVGWRDENIGWYGLANRIIPDETDFIINKNSGIFHKQNNPCGGVANMNESNKIYRHFTTSTQLIREGYQPCQKCF
ncbi:hypothetical protein [uncultured Dubosiella sp.]|uniref:hypothetical protein n=1 Tax=uncultured Dubosiella sp. TaxID=1937011 RepID=UPI0025994F5D|nr:hypothetical protein [uncultured Dubosiella sp.]